AISTATIGLLILGSFFLTLANLSAVVENETQKLDLAVVLQHDLTPQRRKQIYDAAHIAQVKDLQFVPKSRVLQEQKLDTPDLPIDDFMDDKVNPLGDELRIKLNNSEDIFKVHDYLKSIPGVQLVRMDGQVVHSILSIRRFLAVAGLVALAVLGMGILLIIHNAIRLTIFARRREIRIMELVGATPEFIRTPFLLEGIIYGIVGATVAAGVLWSLYIMVTRIDVPLVQQLVPLRDPAVLWQCMSAIILAGLLFGLVGSWVSLSRSIGKATHV
ncbi:MAG: FtsX-like permease family protein, partial [Abitibacteriaceae bacterium]|nr:FtsX-like permease family protein [Abditibacteriaceae bacterium]